MGLLVSMKGCMRKSKRIGGNARGGLVRRKSSMRTRRRTGLSKKEKTVGDKSLSDKSREKIIQ